MLRKGQAGKETPSVPRARSAQRVDRVVMQRWLSEVYEEPCPIMACRWKSRKAQMLPGRSRFTYFTSFHVTTTLAVSAPNASRLRYGLLSRPKPSLTFYRSASQQLKWQVERNLRPRVCHAGPFRVEQGQLAKWLVDNSCLDRVFFCNSGAEAVEAAIKVRNFHHDVFSTGAIDDLHLPALVVHTFLKFYHVVELDSH